MAMLEYVTSCSATTLALWLLLGVSIAFASSLVYCVTLHPLNRYPGPLWARLSRTWAMYHAYIGDIEKQQLALHQKYGYIVRIAPDEVSISDPEAVKIIYNTKGTFPKSDFYKPFAKGSLNKHGNLIHIEDERLHTERRKNINSMYSMSSVVDSEIYIDGCSDLFIQRMEEFADAGKDVNLGDWVQMYAFDVIGELFFSKQFGFLKEKRDYGNFMRSTETLMKLFAFLMQTPDFARPIILSSSLLLGSVRSALESVNNIQSAGKTCVLERQRDLDEGKGSSTRRDVLGKCFELMYERGAQVDFGIDDLRMIATDALFAGADTTANAMRSVIYHLLKSPTCLSKLRDEIDEATRDGRLSVPHIRYAESSKLPYLTAVIKEALRIHPGVGFSLQRLVPAGGATIAGEYFKAGTRVGMNACVVHFDTHAFGSDASQFRPERWLDGEAAAQMEKYSLHFGGGTRTCLGKNISLCELYKLMPELIRRFDMELVDKVATWTTHNHWFNQQYGVVVKLSPRQLDVDKGGQ